MMFTQIDFSSELKTLAQSLNFRLDSRDAVQTLQSKQHNMTATVFS